MSAEASKVLFLLDCGSREAEVLRTIAALLGGQPAEVQGLFVEDEDLIGAASLPCVAEVSVRTLEIKTIDAESASAALARQAVAARSIFEASARQHRLSHSFQVSRGRTIDTLLDAASGRDVVIVSRPLHGGGLRTRAGMQFERVYPAQSDVLFVNEPWQTGTSVVAVCSGDAEDDPVLDKARAIAKAEGLSLVLASSDAGSVRDADHVVSLQNTSAAALVEFCEQYDARLIVISGRGGVDWQPLLTALLDRLSCSLLYVGHEA